MKNYLKKSEGFTMVELLVVMFVVSLLTMAMIAMSEMNSQQQKRENYLNDVEKVMSFFRAARSDAISNRQMGDSLNTDGGFGVYINYYTDGSATKMRLIRYIDNKDSSNADIPDQRLTFSGSVPLDHILEEVVISAFWDFSLENPLPGTVTVTDTLNAIFLPPNSDMIINNNTAAGDMRSVDTVFEFDGRKKRICLNRVARFFEILSGEQCT